MTARVSLRRWDGLNGWAAGASAWLLTPWSFRLAILGYLALLFVMRGFVFAGGSNDDSEQLLYSQSLELGYDIKNPPLYTWLVIAAQQALGVSLAAVTVVKFGLLALIYLLFHETARLTLRDERWAIVAGLSPLAVYHIAWDMVQNYSHSVLVLFACLFTIYVVVRLERAGHVGWFAMAGVALAIGALSKYTYLLFALGVVGAALVEPDFRRRVLDRRIGVTIVVFVLLTAAPYYWTFEHLSLAPQVAAGKFAIKPDASFIQTRLFGVVKVVTSLIEILLPLALLLPLFFWPALRPLPASADVEGDIGRDQRFLRHLFLIMLAGAALIVLVTGATRIRNHLFLVFAYAPLWFFARARLAGISERRVHYFVAVILGLAVVVPAVTGGKYLIDPLRDGAKPYFNVPYAALASALAEAGFVGGTVYTADTPYPLSGNLRPYLPGARFLTRKYPLYTPPQRDDSGQCLIVWEADRREGIATAMRAAADRRFGIDASGAAAREGLISLPFALGWGRRIRFGYRLYPDGAGDCR